MAVLSRAVIIFAAAATIGCIGADPRDREPAVQGDFDDGDTEHRPGQPCLLCHGFEIAGTVFGLIDDPDDRGLEDVLVSLTDAEGFEFSALSNRAGNFMFSVDTGLDDIRMRDRGRTTLPKHPVYPLEVTISRGGDEQDMKTKIWREGSCARCHDRTPSAASVGRVYLFEDPTP